LVDSNAERQRLSAQVEHEAKERKRVEEEFRVVKISLEEQLAKCESETRLITNNFQNERQTYKKSLDNLQQQFNTLHDLFNNGLQGF